MRETTSSAAPRGARGASCWRSSRQASTESHGSVVTGATASVARRVAEEPLDEHAVAPLPVEAAVAPLHPDLLESSRQVDRPARGVGGEDPRGRL